MRPRDGRPSNVSMNKRRIGIAGMIILLIAIGVWLALPKHGSSPVTAASLRVTKMQAHEEQIQPASDPVKRVASDVWTRPPAKVAAIQFRRSGFAWILRQLGASEKLLDRLTDGEVLAVLTELKAGDGETATEGAPGWRIRTKNAISGRESIQSCSMPM
jgi:hypothetical protein